MITKAIIEDVNEEKVSAAGSKEYTSLTVYTYKVRLPIFHGYKGIDAVKSDELPTAVCCTLPHMEEMQYRKNDVVYVSIEDFDLSNIVILGMVPAMQQTPLTGANNTQSKLVFKNVETFLMDKKGTAELPADLKVFMDDKTNPYYVRNGSNNYVSGTEISMLKGMDSSIVERFDRVNQSVSAFSNRFQLTARIVSSIGVSNLVIDSAVWVQNSGFLQNGYDYTFKHTTNVGSINIWTVYVNGKNYAFTKETLQTQCGIRYTFAGSNSTIHVGVEASPLSYKYGGTSADNYDDARKNMGVYHDVMIHKDSYTALEAHGRLAPNTVYYIYTDEVEDNG